MKFIVDAQLPHRLVSWIRKKGHDVIHTINLPEGNLTDDLFIIELSCKEERVVISKDMDFYNYFLLHGKPYKLILLTTGNIVNKELIALFVKNFDVLIQILNDNKVIEMDNKRIMGYF